MIDTHDQPYCVKCGKRTASTCIRCDEPCCSGCMDAGFLCDACGRIERAELREAMNQRRLELEELERD